jgi:16S rRNA (cytidine1402-2'-O)-methyltransferase
VKAKLILCGTPIGNLDDMSLRAVEVLRAADVIACEDTRRTRKLLTHFGIEARDLVVYNEQNERRRSTELVQKIKRGQTVVLVSDAGMPGLSDPGYRLVEAAVAAGVVVEVVPGPNAAVSALAISGLPPGRFVFEGFLPRRSAERKRHIAALADEARTLVFYESPHRVDACLADLAEVLGPRPAALARELTKMYEEVRRGTLEELLESVRADPPRGEIVLVIQGAVRDHKAESSPAELAAAARELMDEGVARKEALVEVARRAGVPKRKVFDALLESPADSQRD